MKIRTLALASLLAVGSVVSVRAQFASAVVDYNSGTGFAAGYTNTAAALGAPSQINPYSDATDPFDSAYGKNQLVSIGAGGSLTLRFDSPIIHNPSNPFGLDFMVFGNTFFVITNGDYSGGGITSGALGGNNPGATRIEVSADGTNWFTLNPALAPTADNLFPTDGLGDPGLPVNPALTGSSFAGLGLAGIRTLYNGSAGGTGYNLAWAQDTNGNFANLPIVRYVRVNVLSNKSEIDAVAAVRGTAPVFAEDFYLDPLQNGWKAFGDTNLFHWNPTNQNIEVTWDSSQTNSYFYHPLGTVLARNDAFSLAFDLRLTDIPVENGFQIAVGLLNLASATNANFFRGSGNQSPNLAEFDYFPDYLSVDATTADTNSGFNFLYDNFALNPGTTYHLVLSHAAGDSYLNGQIFTNGQLYASLTQAYTPASFTDFRLDTVSINSFSDANSYGSSILAHGTVDNFVVSLPPPPVQTVAVHLQSGQWQAQFSSRSHWLYTLERTTDFVTWTAVAAASGNGTNLLLTDPNTPLGNGFYRIRADRP
jgi:hypothetical protein